MTMENKSLPEPLRWGIARGCRILQNVKVPMRDRVRLSTTIYLPLQNSPCPAVLVRTPYNRMGFYDPYFTAHGMALVVQDCRGRYDSEGEFYPFVHEVNDGFDTLAWLAAQPWCNGRIGMFGDSYLAATQFAAAVSGSPHLTALNPRFMTTDPWKRGYYCDGAFSLGLTWSWLCFEMATRTSQAAIMPLFDVAQLLRRLPIAQLDEFSGAGVVPAYRDYVNHSAYDEHWAGLSLRDKYHHFKVPVLLTGGWYDYYPGEAVSTFLNLRRHAPTPELRDSHRLILGPWTHGINQGSVLGEIDFGEQATAENLATHRWLDCLLHGKSPAEFQAAPIRLFVMGVNQWRDEYEWPLARTRYVKYYLRRNGRLTLQSPGDEPPDQYTYDPEDPIPTLGGNHSIGPYNPGLYELAKPGPYDQRPIEARPDVLVFTSDPLEEDTEVTGPVLVHLYASSSVRDTDFVARLTDVYPDGRSINITEGILRARFREGMWSRPSLLEPHRVYHFTIDLQVTSNVFKRGHRLRLQITSSGFPLWDRNLNTGRDPATDAEPQVAEQTIYHDSMHPSHLLLPIIPPEG